MAWRKPKDFRDWIRTVFRHKKKFFFPALAVMILVMLASQRMPREYTAEATFQRYNDPALTQMTNRTIDVALAIVRRNLAQDIKGGPAVAQLVEDLKLTTDLPHNQDGELTPQGQKAKFDMVRQIQNRIGISYDVQSDERDQIKITFTDARRDLVPKVVNKIVDSYISRTRLKLEENLLQAASFFEHQKALTQNEVQDLTQKKMQFQMDHPGLTPDDPTNIQTRTNTLRAAVDQLKSDLDKAKAEHDELATYVGQQPEFIERKTQITNPELDRLIAIKMDIEQKLSDQVNRMHRTEFHPEVQALRRQLAEIEKKIKATANVIAGNTEREPNVERLRAEGDVRVLEGRISAYSHEFETKSRELEQYEILNHNFFVIRNDFAKINRDLDEANRQRVFWDDYYNKTSLAVNIERQQQGIRLSPVQAAPDFVRPSKPTLLGIISAALALGLGAGGILVLISELLDHSFRNVEHAVDELKLPVLGTVNEIVTPQEAFRRKVLNTSFYPAIGAVMILILLASMALAYLSLEEPDRFDMLKDHPAQYFQDMFLKQ